MDGFGPEFKSVHGLVDAILYQFNAGFHVVEKLVQEVDEVSLSCPPTKYA